LGILAAIAIPRFGTFRGDAAKNADIASARSIENAILVGIANGDIIPPASGTITITATNGSPNTAYTTNATTVATFPKAAGTTVEERVTAVMTNLAGVNVKAQVAGKTGFVATITNAGDVSLKYIDGTPIQ
jgi:type II secretory pathway pseudopilin PulG